MARQSPKTPEPLEPPGLEKARARAPREARPPVFKKSERPGSVWKLLAWAIFENLLLERYAKTLSRRQWLGLLWRAYLAIAFLALALYLIDIGITVGLALPVRFPEACVSHTGTLALFLATILVINMPVDLAFNRAIGLIMSLVVGLPFSLLMGIECVVDVQVDSLVILVITIVLCMLLGLVVSLVIGPPINMSAGIKGSLALSLLFGMFTTVGDLVEESSQVVFSLAVTSSWAFGLLRIPFYSWHVFRSAFGVDFYRNPYLRDDGIMLPLPGVRARLTALAAEDPETARRFTIFLLEYRPSQRGLAMHLAHAASAGEWRQHVLDPDHLLPPELVAEERRLLPSAEWLAALRGLAAELRSSKLQSSIDLKKKTFERFAKWLDGFREQTLREPYRWHRYYLGVIDLWREEARKQLTDIEREAQRLEPISPNVYRPRDALRPETDRHVFVGRDDLRERLAREILTAPSMPLLLIQGQRRVGKTSLLNFLPELLGHRFVVVYQDLQGVGSRSVHSWMTELRRRIEERLGQSPDGWQAPSDWLAAWAELEEFLRRVGGSGDRKLILALDEYQELHNYLSQDPLRGGQLLGAMRSFSQHQNQVVLLFVGSELFSELHDPDWANYFVQAVRFPVDYLPKKDAVRLITDPVRLRYAPEVIDRLYDLTQGHPALLQLLCRKLVDIANRKGRSDLSLGDLEQALAEAIDRETSVFSVFWNQFCRQRGCRQAVEQILQGEPPANRVALMQLQEHGYIVENDGKWGMRVPLFDTWLRRYKDAHAGSVSV